MESFTDLHYMPTALLEPEHGPMTALDLHLSLWEWSKTPGRLEKSYESLMRQYDQSLGYTQNYGLYAEDERRMLNRARTIYITAPMFDVAVYNAGIEWTFSDEDRRFWDTSPRELHLDESRVSVLRREMLPAEEGFLVLDKPFPLIDYDTDLVKTIGAEHLPYIPVFAIGWQVANDVSTKDGARPGLVIYLYAYPPQEILEPMKWRYGSAPPLMLVDFSGWPFDREYEVSDWIRDPEAEKEAMEAQIRPHVASVRMFLSSIFGLMNSYITREKPGRAQMKRARRLDMPEDGDVTVIHLRKFLQEIRNKTTADDYDDEGNPHWSHRWIVRGHWAWRSCKCHSDGRHRVYIDPYIKGPEHLPLVIKEKVYSVDR